MKWHAAVLPLLLCAALSASASEGDRSSIFINCLHKCRRSHCRAESPYLYSGKPLPFFQRLTYWSCEDECRYDCARWITDNSVRSGEKPVQYYGKWHFERRWGLQEPASVLFSIGNGYAHAKWSLRGRRSLPEWYGLRNWMALYGLVSCNAWIWSSVYHARDWPWTEKMDYISAFATIHYTLFFSLLIVFRPSTPLRICTILAFMAFLLHHVQYLGFTRFDYAYNAKVCIFLAVVHHLLWIVWSIRNKGRRPHWHMPLVSVVAMSAAMGLEVFDFPPWWDTFDAHSLWHAATIPVIPYWYRFLIREAKWECARGEEGGGVVLGETVVCRRGKSRFYTRDYGELQS